MSQPRAPLFVEQVVTNVAAALDESVFELTPLGEAVDLELVDSFFERSALPAAGLVVAFDYDGHTVTVDGTGDVTLSESLSD